MKIGTTHIWECLSDIDGPRHSLSTVHLGFDPDEPLHIEATFLSGRDTPVWHLDRSLLASGGGYGDVTVYRDGQHLTLTLATAQGSSTLRAPLASVDAFLARTYSLVPIGGEVSELDVDAALVAIFAEAEL